VELEDREEGLFVADVEETGGVEELETGSEGLGSAEGGY